MVEQLKGEIIMASSAVPGLDALASVDFATTPRALAEKDWAKGVTLVETPSGYDVTIAIFVSPEVRTSVIVAELSSSIKNVFHKNKAKLNKIVVNVRGIK